MIDCTGDGSDTTKDGVVDKGAIDTGVENGGACCCSGTVETAVDAVLNIGVGVEVGRLFAVGGLLGKVAVDGIAEVEVDGSVAGGALTDGISTEAN
jgi:hypothetical protein